MSLQLSCSCPGRFIKHDKSLGPTCSKCGTRATIAPIPASRFQQVDYNYECPITGKPIQSKAAHESNLALHGKHVFEKGEFADAERTRKELNEAFEDKVCESAAQLVHNLPQHLKDQLEQELLTSDINLSRGTL